MNNLFPETLRDAQERGIEYFMGENCEWKFEIEKTPRLIEKIVECSVCVFANNGYGDYLFLMNKGGSERYSEEVYEYFHEGPEIIRVSECLEVILGLKDRPPSNDEYPKAVYKSGEFVQVGDQVQVKVWAQFWKGWQEGAVEYVPGVSKKNLAHEHGGLKWVAIKFRDGQICHLVDPVNGILRKVRFIARGISTGESK
jgi:hypothetical protein